MFGASLFPFGHTRISAIPTVDDDCSRLLAASRPRHEGHTRDSPLSSLGFVLWAPSRADEINEQALLASVALLASLLQRAPSSRADVNILRDSSHSSLSRPRTPQRQAAQPALGSVSSGCHATFASRESWLQGFGLLGSLLGSITFHRRQRRRLHQPFGHCQLPQQQGHAPTFGSH